MNCYALLSKELTLHEEKTFAAPDFQMITHTMEIKVTQYGLSTSSILSRFRYKEFHSTFVALVRHDVHTLNRRAYTLQDGYSLSYAPR